MGRFMWFLGLTSVSYTHLDVYKRQGRRLQPERRIAMNRRVVLSLLAGLAALGLTSTPGRADGGQLSPERLDMVDQMGYFTPDFKAAVHELVDSKHALEQAQAEKVKLTGELPDLQKQVTEAEAKEIALRQELAEYEHPEETDFVALQKRMSDAGAKPEEQIMLAQAYVWTCLLYTSRG